MNINMLILLFILAVTQSLFAFIPPLPTLA